MRVVIVSTHAPYPPTSGGRIRLGALVAALSAGHEVRLFLLSDESDQNLERVRSTRVSIVRVHHVAWDRLSLGRRARHNVAALIRGTTPVFESITTPATDALIRQEAATADVLILDTTSLAPYAAPVRRAAPKVKILINTHDVDSVLFRRLATASRSPIGKLHKRLLAANAERVERAFHRYADAVLAVSDLDGQTLGQMNRNAVPIYVVPNAINTAELRPLPPSESPTIIFCGVLNYQPNVEGIRWFVERVFPTVRARIPKVSLLLVGRRPPPDISAYGNREGIQMIGEVDDVRDSYARSAIAIVPLLTGGGTRLKILEAMAFGRVVVSTTAGAEGIGRSPGLLLADVPAEFAQRIIDLLLGGVPAQLAESNVRYVEEHHSWRTIGHDLDAIVRTPRRSG